MKENLVQETFLRAYLYLKITKGIRLKHGCLQSHIMPLLIIIEHERKANYFYFGKLDLSKRIDYLETNGFKHYGVVITGPTKEILKLREEPWVGDLKVDEVSFWNWNN